MNLLKSKVARGVAGACAAITLSSCAGSAENVGVDDRPLVAISVIHPESHGVQYSAQVLDDGKAVFVGQSNVKTLGRVEYRLPRENVEAIRARLNQADFGNLKPGALCALTRAEGSISASYNGRFETLQMCAVGVRGSELFRDLQSLLNTEEFRCPVAIKDYGALGAVDVCRLPEAILSRSISEVKAGK